MSNDVILPGEAITADKLNNVVVGSTSPSAPLNGQIWVDTSVSPPQAKIFDISGPIWRPIAGFGTPNLSFGTSNSAGSASTTIRSDATLALFDTSLPTLTGRPALSTGSANRAARRDHVHRLARFTTESGFNEQFFTGSEPTLVSVIWPASLGDNAKNVRMSGLIWPHPVTTNASRLECRLNNSVTGSIGKIASELGTPGSMTGDGIFLGSQPSSDNQPIWFRTEFWSYPRVYNQGLEHSNVTFFHMQSYSARATMSSGVWYDSRGSVAIVNPIGAEFRFTQGASPAKIKAYMIWTTTHWLNE